MKITDLEFYLVAIPRNEGSQPRRSLLVRLVSESGHEGWGEGNLPWRPNELPARRQALLPLLSGRSFFHLEELSRLDALRPPALKSALEIACWDLIGRETKHPICRLLGGLYRPRIPLAVRLPSDTPDKVALRARELAERGFHSQIVNSRGTVAEDAAQIAAIHELLADRVELSLDANNQFDLTTAGELCLELESFPCVRYLVDPIRGGDIELTGYLRRQTPVPIAVQRSIRSPADVLHLAKNGAARLALVNFDLVGGLSAARACAIIAEASDLGIALVNPYAVGPALAAMLQLTAAVPSFSFANECAFHELRGRVLAERLEMIDGMITVPQGPGLGVDIDRALVERYLVT